MSNRPKRHHHLAQTIQRNFLEKGRDKLWWYSRERDAYEERTTYGIAHARHTYTFSAINGDVRYTLEHALSKVENAAGPAFKKLEKAEELTQEERNAVAEFVGFQYLRTPSKITVIQKMRDAGGARVVDEIVNRVDRMTAEEYAAYTTKYEAKTGNSLSISRDELIESLKNRPPKMLSTKEGTLASLVDLGTELAIEYSKRSWVVMHSPRDSSFITSSEGVFSSGRQSERGTSPGPGVQGVQTVFPFSRHEALLIEGTGPPSIRHTKIDKRAVRAVNDRLATVSGEIYGSPRRLLESIVARNNLASTRFALELDQAYMDEVFAGYRQVSRTVER